MNASKLADQPPHSLLPLAAMMLAGSLHTSAHAQASEEKTLKTVTVQETAESPTQAKESLLVKNSGIAKGNQAIKDIPQTVTVMTEKLIDERNLDDFREVLKTTAGVTFQAGETGEEDIRMRGFSLQQAGDIYVDGLRDAPLVERDTFNTDRVEVLKGSASMLFGKGSTGGIVNQVNKQPFLMDQNEVNVTAGSGEMYRLTGDFNKQLGENAAMRINAMVHKADNWGAKVDKKGVAGSYRWGIGERDEYNVSLYSLQTHGRPLYNHPWFLIDGVIQPSLPAKNYYGLVSDYLNTESTFATFTHSHRFDSKSEVKTTVRHGRYERDLWASVIRFPSGTTASTLRPSTEITRSPKGRYGQSDLTQIQSDFTNTFDVAGQVHELIAGVDFSREDALRNNSNAGTSSGLTTTVGTPNDGDWRADTRAPVLNSFKTNNFGIYAQDTVKLTPQIKVLGGIRIDEFKSTYVTHACSPVQKLTVKDSLLSPRVGMMFQQDASNSYYASFGTSYNTSGDSYGHAINACAASGSNNAKILNTPPEESRNFELGGKFEVLKGRGLLGIAWFYSEKYNERNTDEPTADSYLLSGKRHASGMEFNFAGRVNSKWEVFYNHTWIPEAQIDNGRPRGSSGGAQQEGDRPALTPKHSASIWATYRVNTQWRMGAGLNHRSKQNPEGNRTTTAPAFTTLDLMAEYVVNDTATLKLNVSNATDELYADSLYRGFYAPGAPRRLELTLKTLF